ncbi:hypothetical protein BBO99_00006140 [Phytophthora kernoviae]|uniref:Sulfatase N-terminal domain-containing protein n=1 Tax=Phytophthora kernoviae TaxID=325452 RepID=A0A3R7GXH6_9STRA|nr:hypothetical protein JM16_005992 [Phytophthora kernoviae]RLN02712.1 hypothetical protein BBI17_006276 [Phytophthora kernoviae]RLN78178.1 hypothetical protein BBO99_00006140 [Phytophthora kernoviae]
MYGTEEDMAAGVGLSALGLGMLEDFVCATYLVATLWLIDFILSRALGAGSSDTDSMTVHTFVKWKQQRILRRVVTFVTSWMLFLAMTAPFAADMLFVRLRRMRFTFEVVAMAIAERDMISSVPISNSEYREAYLTGTVLIIIAVFFAAVRTWASWADLMRWNPVCELLDIVSIPFRSTKDQELWTPKEVPEASDSCDDVNEGLLESGKPVQYAQTVTPKRGTVLERLTIWLRNVDWPLRALQLVVAVLALVVLPVIVLATSQACSPLVANVGMNTTLNELFMRALRITEDGFVPVVANGTIERASAYIHKTENYSLSAGDSLYRKTTGFQGDLAFNITVDDTNPPNVVVIAVESFRFHDSHYLVGDEDPSNLFKGWNGTVVPNFDKWAKRGVAFPNLWSSWKTSRSVASLVYAQVPYDSTESTDMKGGRADVELSGMPQLFKGKGYETFFTTGCQTVYDDWGVFLPAHGFDTLWGREEFKKLAQSDLGISKEDWSGSAHRESNWGVHDDVSFELLGDLLINKTKDQADRMAAGENKQPLFLTHYTISSHVNYLSRPKWYADEEKPDFSALYEGEKYADNIKAYAEIRYFTDMELGKFMDRMETEGILNDTIVLIVGDHGQAPEFGNDTPQLRDLSCTRVAGALIAEGRLGKYAGLKIEDAVEQYDMLNTLADITGVPKDGFYQDGVGRSLKRSVTLGERVVYSNNPNVKNSIVRGHERLRYDRSTSSVLLHNVYTDHDMKNDLFPELTTEKKNQWLEFRDQGRQVTAYYKKRWEGKCLLAATCDS